MKNIKKIVGITSMILLGSIILSSSIYAEETSLSGATSTGTTSTGGTSTGVVTPTNIGGGKDSHGCYISAGYSWCASKSKCIRSWEEKCEIKKVEANWIEFHDNYGFLKDYLKTDITKEQRAVVKQIMQEHMKEVKDIIKAGKEALKNGTFDKTAYDASIVALVAKHTAALLPYIDSTKVEQFNTFMKERQATIQENVKIIKNVSKVNKIKLEIKKTLSQKNIDLITKKLETFTLEQCNKLMEKIDKLIAKAKKETVKAQLEEIKTLVQTRINALN